MLLCASARAANDALLLQSVDKYIPSGIFIAVLMVIWFFLEQYVEKGMGKKKPAVIDGSSRTVRFVPRARD